MPVLKVLTLLGVVGLGAATVAALLARAWWAFDLFSHFRLQYLVLALVLLVLALVLRWLPAAAVLVLIALVHGVALKDVWLARPAPGPAGQAFRVAAANVLTSNPKKGEVLAFARASDADLLVLVEAERPAWRPVLAEIGDVYPHAAPAGWQDGAPVILFSRYPIGSNRLVEAPAGRRPYLLAEVALPAGEVVVAGVHPSSPSPRRPEDTRRRNEQLDHIAAEVDDASRPLIVT
ncbi:MAG: hypothetical protein R3285_08990, partial [Kiloniellales bacterium]|nr:hypothetical protein [Kiloniellales bacterium]